MTESQPPRSLSGLANAQGQEGAVPPVDDPAMAGQAYHRLAESEEQLRAILRLSPVGIGITRLNDGAIVDFNDAMLEIIGYQRDEVIGQSSANLRIWADAEQRARVFARLSAGEPVRDLQSAVRRKDGSLRQVRFSAEVVDLGGVSHMVGTLSDVSGEVAAREALELSEKRLRLSLSVVPLAIFHQDRELRYTYMANPQLGFSSESILGLRDDELIGTSAAASLVAIKARVLATGIGERQEVHLDRAGQAYWFDLLVEPELGADGSVVGIVCAAADITERKLREARYRGLVEDQTELIARFRGDGSFVFVNEAYCRFFGTSFEQCAREHWQPLAYAEDLPMIEAKLAELCLENPVVTIENRVYAGDGSVHWMQFVNRGFFDAGGKLLETQSVGRDITPTKVVEERLKASEERFALTFEAIEDGLWDWDLVADRAYLSPRYYEIIGYQMGEVTPDFAFFLGIVHPEDRPKVLAVLDENLHGRDPGVNFEFRLVTRSGAVKWMQSRGRIVAWDATGRPTRAVGAITDISESKALVEALHRSEDQLQALVQANDSDREAQRKEIAREIHDQLGATLTATGFQIETLRRRLGGDDQAAADLARIRNLVAEASTIAREICTRLRPPVLDDLGLIPTCRWYLDDWSETVGITATGCFADLAAEPPENLRTDIFRILQELLTNVVRHAGANRVQVSMAASGGWLTLSVHDDGQGFIVGRQEGFGLVGVRERARRHGGDVLVESAPSGTEVGVRIPWVEEAAAGGADQTRGQP